VKNSPGETMQPLVYILAASHSGSTLLAMLLNAHPDVCTVGELGLAAIGDVRRYRCSCGQFILDCRFWRDVRRRMMKRGFEFDISQARVDYRTVQSEHVRRLLRPLHRGVVFEAVRDIGLGLSGAWRRELALMQRKTAALAEAICESYGAKILVDSSKRAIRLKYLLRNPRLDVKVIRLIRDGRGVALAYMDPARFADASKAELRGGGCGGNRQGERLSVRQAAYEWRRSNEEAEMLTRRLDPDRWIEVRYEDLCTRTRETLDGILGFLEVDPAKHISDFRSVEHHVVGNGMRLDRSSRIRLDERWRTALSDADLRVFDAVAGDLNRRYGYH